jgi:hypothetical protein
MGAFLCEARYFERQAVYKAAPALGMRSHGKSAALEYADALRLRHPKTAPVRRSR